MKFSITEKLNSGQNMFFKIGAFIIYYISFNIYTEEIMLFIQLPTLV